MKKSLWTVKSEQDTWEVIFSHCQQRLEVPASHCFAEMSWREKEREKKGGGGERIVWRLISDACHGCSNRNKTLYASPWHLPSGGQKARLQKCLLICSVALSKYDVCEPQFPQLPQKRMRDGYLCRWLWKANELIAIYKVPGIQKVLHKHRFPSDGCLSFNF